MRLLLPLVLLVLATAACGSSGGGGSDDPSGSSSPTSSPSSSSPSASPVRSDVAMTPEHCTMPRLAVGQDVVVRLLYGRADTTSLPGVRLTLTTAAPGGDTVALLVTRSAQGCRGRAELSVRAHQPFTVLGITAESSAATADPSVPNRATATLTVRRSPA